MAACVAAGRPERAIFSVTFPLLPCPLCSRPRPALSNSDRPSAGSFPLASGTDDGFLGGYRASIKKRDRGCEW